MVERSELQVLIREFSEYEVLVFEFLNPFNQMGNEKAFLQDEGAAFPSKKSEMPVPVLHSLQKKNIEISIGYGLGITIALLMYRALTSRVRRMRGR